MNAKHLLLAAAMAALAALGPTPEKNPTELGRVTWGRDLAAAFGESARTGRPVLVLFQEIPGCQTCVNFGQAPLSHPLLVEAIETEFVPVAVYNNKPGTDEQIRERYGEPAWNYPVMRFLDAGGADIVPRQDGIWSSGAVAARLVEALKAAGRPVPPYLLVAAVETAPQGLAKATFAMHCFWEGEERLGALGGVIRTRPGFIDDREVVELVYDPQVIGYRDLIDEARRLECADAVWAHSQEQLEVAVPVLGNDAHLLERPAADANAGDDKYALARTPIRYLPLTPMQATKINADLRRGTDPAPWLSPRQVVLLASIEAALAADPEALDGLARADSLDGLADYEDALMAELDERAPQAPAGP